jgi:hypothetical protein
MKSYVRVGIKRGFVRRVIDIKANLDEWERPVNGSKSSVCLQLSINGWISTTPRRRLNDPG